MLLLPNWVRWWVKHIIIGRIKNIYHRAINRFFVWQEERIKSKSIKVHLQWSLEEHVEFPAQALSPAPAGQPGAVCTLTLGREALTPGRESIQIAQCVARFKLKVQFPAQYSDLVYFLSEAETVYIIKTSLISCLQQHGIRSKTRDICLARRGGWGSGSGLEAAQRGASLNESRAAGLCFWELPTERPSCCSFRGVHSISLLLWSLNSSSGVQFIWRIFKCRTQSLFLMTLKLRRYIFK